MYVKCGNVTIAGGTFKGVGPAVPFKHSGNGANPTGDAVIVEACDYPGGYPTISVTGGTFLSDNASGIASYAQTGHEAARPTKFITGGTFSNEIPADLIADGYELVQEGDKYVVKQV